MQLFRTFPRLVLPGPPHTKYATPPLHRVVCELQADEGVRRHNPRLARARVVLRDFAAFGREGSLPGEVSRDGIPVEVLRRGILRQIPTFFTRDTL